ncbi:MAG: BLUF domain-containing protein [Pseudomonadota bacterium]
MTITPAVAQPAKLPIRLHEVLYVSVMAPDLPISTVADIAGKARIANDKAGITGLLIFDGQRFCQQLEGDRKAVLKLLERIREDPRHTQIEVLHHSALAERRFRRFGLAYTMVEDIDTLARLEQLDGQAAVDAFVALISTLDMA